MTAELLWWKVNAPWTDLYALAREQVAAAQLRGMDDGEAAAWRAVIAQSESDGDAKAAEAVIWAMDAWAPNGGIRPGSAQSRDDNPFIGTAQGAGDAVAEAGEAVADAADSVLSRAAQNIWERPGLRTLAMVAVGAVTLGAVLWTASLAVKVKTAA